MPYTSPLIDAAEKLIRENANFRRTARSRAESVFPVEKMAEAYVEFCLNQDEEIP